MCIICSPNGALPWLRISGALPYTGNELQRHVSLAYKTLQDPTLLLPPQPYSTHTPSFSDSDFTYFLLFWGEVLGAFTQALLYIPPELCHY